MLTLILVLGLLQPAPLDLDTQPQSGNDYGQAIQVTRTGWDIQPQEINGAGALQGSHETLQSAYVNATQ